MSISLGPILDAIAPYMTEAVQTAGTYVTITRPAAGGTLDADTATLTPSASTVIAATIPAIVVPEASASAAAPYPGQPGDDLRWRIILTPDVTAVLPGDVVEVGASRDARLVGRAFIVTASLDNTTGVARILAARAQPDRGRT